MSEKKPVNLNRTIWISLFTSLFYGTVAVIETPTATSNNTPKQYLAQSDRETTTPKPSNTEENTIKKTRSEAESTPVENTLEKEIIAELNRARTDPQGYADWLETQKQYYQGMLLKLPGEQPIRTNRGLRSLEEAITFLRQQNQLPALSPSTKLTDTAKQQITAISNNQTINSENNLVYNKLTPEAIVMQLVVDDGFPDRPHRLAIFNQSYQNAGIACSKIPVYDNVCAIAYKDETTDIEQQPTATTPSSTDESAASTTENNNPLPTPPSISTPVIPKPEITTSPTTTEEEVVVNTESPSNTNEETTETEVTPTVESNTSETETEVTPTVESNNSETETETEVTPTVEPNTSETETETEAETEVTPTVESNNSEAETETETATNSETNNTSEAVEIVEAGILQEGDETIPNDGSFYDSFPLEASAGDSFTITLESSDFDTFLAIMDRDGNIIEQNDDISEEDSNSILEITLPDNGTYSVIVNAYDKGGKGNYVLKVSR